MALRRMDNVGIVVEDLDAAVKFFRELGLNLEGRGTIEGEWAGRVTGLGDQRVEVAKPPRIGSATSAGLKGFSSGSRRNSSEQRSVRRLRHTPRLRSGSGAPRQPLRPHRR